MESDLVSKDCFHYFSFTIAVERRLLEQHHVEDHAGSPHVALLIIPFAKNFRRNIVGSAYARSQMLIRFLFLDGDAKVDQLYAPGLLLEQNILRFHVPVHHIFGMYIGQGF